MKLCWHSIPLTLALLWSFPGLSADCIFPGSFTLTQSGTGPFTYTFTVDLDTVPGNDTKAIEIIYMLSDGSVDTVCYPPPLVNPLVHTMTSSTSGLTGSLTYTSWTANNGECQGGTCSGGTVMPIDTRSFSAVPRDGRVYLRWISENTADDLAYVVERSIDVRSFTAIGRIDLGQRGGGALPFEYVDEQPPVGVVYYRIRTLAVDGGTSTTGIHAVRIESRAEVHWFPNPVRDRLFLNVDDTLPEEELVTLSNAAGKQLRIRLEEIITRGYLDCSGLEPGVWFMHSPSLGHHMVVRLD